MRRAGLIVATVLVAPVLLAGCGTSGVDDPGAGPGDDQQREWQVAGDPHATASEIVEAGRPVDVGGSGDRRVITYVVQSDDDEGPQQGAWRMYDATGKRIADGTLGTVSEQGAQAGVRAVADGFLLENYTDPQFLHLAADGSVEPVAVGTRVEPAQAGDLLLEAGDDQGRILYHQADRSTSRLPQVPSDNPQSVLLDARGTVWMMRPWGDDGAARIAWSAGGTAPWHDERVPLGDGNYPLIDLAIAGDRLALFAARDGADEYPVVDAVWTRPVSADGHWTRVDLTGVKPARTLSPRVRALADGRLLVTGDEGPVWLQDGDGFRAIDLPTEESGELIVVGDDWYARDYRSPGLQVSSDEGRSWSEVPR